MKDDKRYVDKVESISLEFMKQIVELADQAHQIGGDHVEFDIGPIDGISLNVGITFTYKGLQEGKDEDNDK